MFPEALPTSSAPSPLISLRSVRKSFETPGSSDEILHSIDLDLYSGEVVAILGPSGSGKSTLLNILGLLSTPDQGSYTLNGQSVHQLSPAELSAVRLANISFVFQAFHLIGHKNTASNIELPLRYLGLKTAQRREKIEDALKMLGLTHRAQAKVATLSGGEKQRVAIARALVTSPKLLLCDEPTGSLDSARSQEVMSMLRNITTPDRTTVIVTHDPAVAARCDRTITITDGNLSVEPYRGSASAQHPNHRELATLPTSHSVASSPAYSGSGPVSKKPRWLQLGLSEAWDAATHRFKRNLFTALGVALGVASLVLTVGLTATVSGQISSAFNIYLARHLTLSQTDQEAMTAQQAIDLWKSDDFSRLENLNGVSSASLIRPLSTSSLTVTTAPETRLDFPGRQQAQLLSATPNIFITQGQNIINGRSLTESDIQHPQRIAVAGESLLEALGITWQPGLTLYAGNQPITIVGVAEENTALSDYYGALYLPLGVDLPTEIPGSLIISLATDPGAASQVAAEAPYALSPHKPQNFTAALPPSPEKLKDAIGQSQRTMLLLLSGVTLIIGAVGIMNTFLVAVIERRQEVGLRLALGLPPRGIVAQFMTEACLTSAAGTLMGIVVAINCIAVVSLVNSWTPIISPLTIVTGLASGLAIGVLAGIYPAWKASQLDPVTTLNQ